MNLKEIKNIVNSNLPDNIIEREIISILAKDENVIPTMMKILEQEREFKKEIQTQMNLLLSKADVGLDNKKLNKDNFIQNEIKQFYFKYKNYVGHCFKNLAKDNNW